MIGMLWRVRYLTQAGTPYKRELEANWSPEICFSEAGAKIAVERLAGIGIPAQIVPFTPDEGAPIIKWRPEKS